MHQLFEMFHSFVVLTEASKEVIFSRFYADCTEQESFCAELSRLQWKDATAAHSVAVMGDGNVPVVVVFAVLGGLGFFLAGSGDYDELICSETLQVLLEGIVAQCDKELSEEEMLAQHDRISLLVDHVIRYGILEHTEKTIVQAIVSGELDKVSTDQLLVPELERISDPNASVSALTSMLAPSSLKSKAGAKSAAAQLPLERERRVESQIFVRGSSGKNNK